MKYKIFAILGLFILASCGSFQAERVDSKESDERALEITDKWVMKDTENVVEEILEALKGHRGYKRYLRDLGREPTVFIAEVKNLTSEPYFPINDINDEILNRFSATGDFILVDNESRESLLKEIQYQNDGMVDPSTAKMVGKQTGADLLIFGNVFMRPESRDGKTIKQYRVNIRATDLEKGVEVFRTRSKLSKYSEQSKMGW